MILTFKFTFPRLSFFSRLKTNTEKQDLGTFLQEACIKLFYVTGTGVRKVERQLLFRKVQSSEMSEN